MRNPRFIEVKSLPEEISADHALIFLQDQIITIASDIGSQEALGATMNAMTNCAYKFGVSPESYRGNLQKMIDQIEEVWKILDLAYGESEGHG